MITLLVENSVSINGLAAAPTGTVAVTGAPTGTPSSVTLTQSVDAYYGAPIGMATIIVPANATPGTYKIGLTYSGDSNYATGGGTATLTFVAGSGLTSTTTGTLSAPSSTPAALEQISVTIAGQSGKAAPTGTLYALVSDGNQTANSSNVIVLTSAKLPASTTSNVTLTLVFGSQNLPQGTNAVTLFYAGDSTYNSSSGVVTIQNLLSDFTLTAATPSVTIPASGTVADTVNIGSANGFTGSVALSCSATGGVACTLSSPTVTLTNGQTLPVTVTLSGAGVTAAGELYGDRDGLRCDQQVCAHGGDPGGFAEDLRGRLYAECDEQRDYGGQYGVGDGCVDGDLHGRLYGGGQSDLSGGFGDYLLGGAGFCDSHEWRQPGLRGDGDDERDDAGRDLLGGGDGDFWIAGASGDDLGDGEPGAGDAGLHVEPGFGCGVSGGWCERSGCGDGGFAEHLQQRGDGDVRGSGRGDLHGGSCERDACERRKCNLHADADGRDGRGLQRGGDRNVRDAGAYGQRDGDGDGSAGA